MNDLNPTAAPPAERWYWASALYVACHEPDMVAEPLCERIVFLLKASSDAEASALSGTIALSKEHSYQASDSIVTWKLKTVERVEALFDDVLGNGTEVFWQYLTDDAE